MSDIPDEIRFLQTALAETQARLEAQYRSGQDLRAELGRAQAKLAELEAEITRLQAAKSAAEAARDAQDARDAQNTQARPRGLAALWRRQ